MMSEADEALVVGGVPVASGTGDDGQVAGHWPAPAAVPLFLLTEVVFPSRGTAGK
jgi:hypothetical protein